MIKDSNELQYLRHVADCITKDRFALAAVRRALKAPLQDDDLEALKTMPRTSKQESDYRRGYDTGYHAGIRGQKSATAAESSVDAQDKAVSK